MIKAVIQFQAAKIKTNLFTFLLIAVTASLVLYIGYRHGTLKQSMAYLFVMLLSSFFIDLYALIRPAKNDFRVKNPKMESIYFFLCLLLGLVFFYIRFVGVADWEHVNRIVKLAMLPLMLFVFPIALALIMLLLKYKPAELGLRLHGWIVVIPIIAISAMTSWIISPGSFTWQKVVADEGGIAGALFTGFIVAGLSEEFFRVIGQTRVGALLNNKGLGWYITTVLWACMHFPKWYSEEHHVIGALAGSIRIIPIGLMWGYLTHRTKSFLPALLVHGSNFWGLQNF